jgi:hypothetical protein
MPDEDGQQLAAAQAKIASLESGMMRAAVRKEATANGIIDASDIDNIPLDGVTMNQNGTISGVAELVQGFKASKPHWFGDKRQMQNKRATESFQPGAKMPKDVKPGSKEHAQIEQDYMNRWSR